MNRHELFRDVLDEGTAAEFEEAVLRKTIRTARRVRRNRIAIRTALACAVILGVAIQFREREEPGQTIATAIPAEAVVSYQTIRSESFRGIMRSEPLSRTARLATRPESVAVLSTSEARGAELRIISDEELLSFFEGKAVALVNRGSAGAELVFPGERWNEAEWQSLHLDLNSP